MLNLLSRMLRPVRRRSLDAAGSGRRWSGAKTVGNLNAENAAAGGTVAGRINSLYHNDAAIRAAVDALAANIVGCGFVPVCANKALVALWRRWIAHADAAGRLDADGLARHAALSMIRDGECFALLRLVPDAGLPVPLQLELLHRDQLPMEVFSTAPRGGEANRVRAGIEFGADNRPVAYHFLAHRPGDPAAPLDGAPWETVRVPAEDVLHIFRPLEIGQVRGLPWGTATALLAHELAQYRDAALVKAKVGALFAGFVTDPEGGAAGLPGSAAGGVLTAPMEPGALINLPVGSTVTFSDPPDSDDFDAFAKAQLRAIAAGMGCTYEQISGDYAGVTFSSVRAAMIEFRRRIEPIQYEFAHQFYRPIWRRFVTLAVLSGAVDAPDFFEDPEAYLSCDWLPPRWDYVNPAQDVAAEVDAIAAGLKSRSQVIAERGYDPAAVDAERARDAARERALGLAADGQPRRTPFGTPLDDHGEPVAAPGGPHA